MNESEVLLNCVIDDPAKRPDTPKAKAKWVGLVDAFSMNRVNITPTAEKIPSERGINSLDTTG